MAAVQSPVAAMVELYLAEDTDTQVKPASVLIIYVTLSEAKPYTAKSGA